MERLQISIPKPCHQDWNQMTPEERGRFCGMCNKTVLDFSDKTEDEILKFINSHRNENLCGRFRSDQLAQPVRIELPLPVYLSQPSFIHVFILALLFCFGTALFSCNMPSNQLQGKVEAQNSEIPVKSISNTSEVPLKNIPDTNEMMVVGGFMAFVEPEPLPAEEKVLTGKVAIQPDTAESPVNIINLPEVDIIDSQTLLTRVTFMAGALAIETIEYSDSFNDETDSTVIAEKFVPNTEENFFSSVYPNPSNGLLNIEFQPVVEQYVQVDLFDAGGRLIRNLVPRQLLQPEFKTIQADVSDQPPGIYFLRISAGEKVKTEKIIIATK